LDLLEKIPLESLVGASGMFPIHQTLNVPFEILGVSSGALSGSLGRHDV
jgi:hypothetical protein